MKQTHGIPALLSLFIPGLGQMVKGEIGKGLVIFICFWISVMLITILIGLITTPIFYIWQIIDAYNGEVTK